MALVVKDRVKETTTTTGTGTITLAGASTGFQSFSAIGNGNTTYYTIAGQTVAEWEVGIGTYTSSGTTLARNTVLASSNSGSAVSFSAGTKDVFVTYPADYSAFTTNTVSSFSGGSTGLTPNTATTGAVSLAGTLAVANGGTGVTTSTGSGAVVLGTSPTLTSPTITGAVVSSMASSVITSGTAVASTSGTSIDFTSIPSWVKRITVMFSGVSTSGTSVPWLIQIGPSGGVETTGYLSSASGSTNVINSTTGFAIYVDNSAASIVGGAITLLLLNSSTNLWSATGQFGQSNRAYMITLGGSKAIAGSLSTIKIKATNGTDTFDAGSINILYE